MGARNAQQIGIQLSKPNGKHTQIPKLTFLAAQNQEFQIRAA